MKTRIFFLIFLALTFGTIRSLAQTEEDLLLEEEMTAYLEDQTVTQYMIVAGASGDFHALEYFAKQLGQKTGVVYDDMGRIYKDSCLVWPETSDDELYRNTYVFRRWEENAISVELNIEGVCFVPAETDERPVMFICAGMFGSKQEAEARLALIKKYVPTAYLKKKEVYMGCMH
jgi:hypothetical protein